MEDLTYMEKFKNLDERITLLNEKLDNFWNEFKGHKIKLLRLEADFVSHMNKIYQLLHGTRGRKK